MLGDLKYPPAQIPRTQKQHTMRRKRGAYFKAPSKKEQKEINDLLTKIEENDGELKYQALLDWYRSKKT